MSQKNKLQPLPLVESDPSWDKEPYPAFTGIARSIVCYNNQKQFRNFKIVTLWLEKGQVVKTKVSDPYASFEALSRLEVLDNESILHINNTWEHGKAFTI